MSLDISKHNTMKLNKEQLFMIQSMNHITIAEEYNTRIHARIYLSHQRITWEEIMEQCRFIGINSYDVELYLWENVYDIII